MKTCSKCNQSKDESNFAFKNKTKGTLQSQCKECHKAYSKQHYTNNTQLYVQKAKKHNIVNHKRNKSFIDSFKRNKTCHFCPESEPVALDFHHLRDKSIEVAKITFGSLERIQSEIDKCIVVCSNCHRKLHAGLLTYK